MKETAEDFLVRAASTGGRVVSSNDLNEFQIAEARREFKFFVTEGGLGFAILPWELTTDKDRKREADYFGRNNMMV
jgi:hypothetical protein